MDAFTDVMNASLSELLDGNSFQEVVQSYYDLFDVPIRVFDRDGNLLVEVVSARPPCSYVDSFEGGRRRCTATRMEIKSSGEEDRESHFTDCFCGLRYLKAPVIYQNEIAGKVVLGPFKPTELEGVPEGAEGVDAKIDAEELAGKLDSMRGVSGSAAKRILGAILSVVDVILFSAHRAYVTSQMHLASVRESYRELTEKNRELAEMNERMQEFERLKSNFLATVSHELRTPLTSIIGYSDMLTEGIAGELDEEQKQFVETIKTKGDELLKLISAILDFSRVETGHLELRWKAVDPKAMIASAADASRDSAERRGTKLSVDVPDGLPEVYLDPEKVATALGHLIENAVKFSHPGGVVRVNARIVSPEEEEAPDGGVGFVLMASPEMLEISVEDYGIGIPEGDQAQIFAPFAQLDNTSTREHGGSGLGLAIVKHFVEAHGGKVIVKSSLDEGSKFAIRIPIVERD